MVTIRPATTEDVERIIALRTQAFDVSALPNSHAWTDFMPPVVLRQGVHIADPPSAAAALRWRYKESVLPSNPSNPPPR